MLLRTFLAASGRTQADAARAVDVSDVTVHHWMHGRIAPRTERRDALAEWSGGAVPGDAWGQAASPEDLAMLHAAELAATQRAERGAA